MECQTASSAKHDPPRYTWVDTNEGFRKVLENLAAAPRMAIDIEADSLYHYFEKVCLIQVSTDQSTYVLDPLAITDLARLAPIMSNSAVEKVFHAASYDVFCLRRDFGFIFARIFDTHLAAQFAGYEFLGLSPLMEKLLGISHSKRRQRDDWSRRPLASEQLEYAAMDTHHLLHLRDVLEKQLRDKGRLSWVQEEFEAAVASEMTEREFDPEGFRRIKGSRELAPRDLVVLRALYLLRDRYAREMDTPPFKVMNNSVLIDLARRPPRSVHEMFKRPGVSYRVARRHAGEILSVIEETRSEDPSHLELPARPAWKPPSHEARVRLEHLRSWRQAKAAELNLQVGVVFPGVLLENLSIFPPVDLESLAGLPGMRRWRIREFGADILRILNNSDNKASREVLA
ncbi:MAG TPA: HRDC domain-containing protein [Acidobacteriota bacterium]|nr:HRDC domain-containing protein [Acidobacteriota bacterium]